MTSDESPKSTGKVLLIIIVGAVLIAVVSTLVQQLVLGKTNAAITGGVIGAFTAVVVINNLKKKSDA